MIDRERETGRCTIRERDKASESERKRNKERKRPEE